MRALIYAIFIMGVLWIGVASAYSLISLFEALIAMAGVLVLILGMRGARSND